MLIVATSRREIQQRFHRAALDAYNAHGFTSYRDAEMKTGVNYSTVYSIVSVGRVPTRGQVIEWAEGLHEPINKWLDLAGYDLISPELLNNGPEDTELLSMIRALRSKRHENAIKRILETAREIVEEEAGESEE